MIAFLLTLAALVLLTAWDSAETTPAPAVVPADEPVRRPFSDSNQS